MTTQPQILLVESNLSAAQAIRSYLAARAFTVFVAPNSTEAFNVLRLKTIQTILLNISLKDIDGPRLCEKLRAQGVSCGILIYAATSVGDTEMANGLKAGATEILSGPFEWKKFETGIMHVLMQPPAHVSREKPMAVPATSRLKSIPPVQKAARIQVTEPSPTPKGHPSTLRLLTRFWDILIRPRHVFSHMNEQDDFLLAFLLVSITPVIASFSQLATTDGLDVWLSALAMGEVMNLFLWLVIGGFLHMVTPFLGSGLTFRKGLLIAGLAWAPRILGAFLSMLYGALYQVGFVIEKSDFSAGISMIPGLPASPWLDLLGRVSVFDVWSAALVLHAIWKMHASSMQKKWNVITVLILLVCLLAGAFTRY